MNIFKKTLGTFFFAVILFVAMPVYAVDNALCWGDNASGQNNIPAGYTWASISPGGGGVLSNAYGYACGVTTMGQGLCWGDNTYGQTSIPAGYTWSKISTQSDSVWYPHTCGITTAGQALCWGSNTDGQSTIPSDPGAPDLFDGGGAGGVGDYIWTDISVASYHTCGVTSAGAMLCWGWGGNGSTNVPAGYTWSKVSAGGSHTCGVTTAGAALCWDANTAPAGNTWTAVSSGKNYGTTAYDRFECGINTLNQALCWGSNSYGQLNVPAGNTWSSVSSGMFYACGITTGNIALCWGSPPNNSNSGQTTVPSGHTWSSISAGLLNTCGVFITNSPPTVPTITGPTSGAPATNYTYEFTSTDSDGDQIRYAIDWDNDGDIDQTTALMNSGTTFSQANQWASTGTKTFAAVTYDAQGARSTATSTYNVTITALPTATLSASESIYRSGNPAITLTWGSANANACDGTNFNTGGATSGSIAITPTETTTYSVVCGTGLASSTPATASITYVSGACQANIAVSGDITGWFKVLSANGSQTGGWDGFISLRTQTTELIAYGVSVLNGIFSGYAWGSTNLGWLDFSYARTEYQCTATYTCPDAQHIASTCTTVLTTCGPAYTCSPGYGACQFNSPDYNSSTYNGTTFTGHLQISPKLVKKGNTTQVHWNVSDVTDCTVTSSGTPQDSWTENASPLAGRTSKQILQQTTYTLTCLDLLGTPLSESAIVNILPEFRER